MKTKYVMLTFNLNKKLIRIGQLNRWIQSKLTHKKPRTKFGIDGMHMKNQLEWSHIDYHFSKQIQFVLNITWTIFQFCCRIFSLINLWCCLKTEFFYMFLWKKLFFKIRNQKRWTMKRWMITYVCDSFYVSILWGKIRYVFEFVKCINRSNCFGFAPSELNIFARYSLKSFIKLLIKFLWAFPKLGFSNSRVQRRKLFTLEHGNCLDNLDALLQLK